MKFVTTHRPMTTLMAVILRRTFLSVQRRLRLFLWSASEIEASLRLLRLLIEICVRPSKSSLGSSSSSMILIFSIYLRDILCGS